MKLRLLCFSVILTLVCLAAQLSAQTMSTIAGTVCVNEENNTGTADDLVHLRSFNGVAADKAGNVYITEWNSGYVLKAKPGDDCLQPIPGTNRNLQNKGYTETAYNVLCPHGIAVDDMGNVYVAQYNGHIVRKISPDGVSTVVAGNGTAGYYGDNGPATAARLASPNDIAIDKQGNLFISDEHNHAIRKVTPEGNISTVAGTLSIKGYSGDHGLATQAQFYCPYGIALIEQGGMYVADTKNNVVRKIDQDGVITTWAGNGRKGYSGDGGPASAASLNTPVGLAVDDSGNLFIADERNNVIRKVTPDGTISTYAGATSKGSDRDDIAATAASLSNPRCIAIDGEGNMFILDFNRDNNRRIHMISRQGGDEGVKVSMGESSGRYIKIDNCRYETVTIIDKDNKAVSTQDVTSRTFKINISMLAPGNYTLDFRKPGHNKLVRFSVSEQ